jgi:hypothetical protein
MCNSSWDNIFACAISVTPCKFNKYRATVCIHTFGQSNRKRTAELSTGGTKINTK